MDRRKHEPEMLECGDCGGQIRIYRWPSGRLMFMCVGDEYEAGCGYKTSYRPFGNEVEDDER